VAGSVRLACRGQGHYARLYHAAISTVEREGRKVPQDRPGKFYQLLTYTDDVDLNKNLASWENF
jgi:hypothetical protein